MYFVMPFVEGGSLRERIRDQGALPVEEALQISRDVGGALQHAHDQGVVHRDVKPSNILLAEGVALLADFGIARAVSAATVSGITASGTAIGTPQYMSPEQLSGDASVDARSDQYSLGCVVYEMLAGEPPFSGSNQRVVAARHLTQQPAPLSGLRPVPRSVEIAVDRALAKTQADRFATISEFLSVLQSDATDAIRRVTARPAAGRGKLMRASAAGILAIALAAFGLAAMNRGPPLDTNRIGGFPVVDRTFPQGDPVGAEQIATYLGYVLEGTDPLRWEEGRDWLTPGERTDPASLTLDRKVEVSRERGVGRILDGDVLRDDDVVRVILRLYDADDGTLLARQGASGEPGASAAALAAQAVAQLLGEMLGDRSVDVMNLSAGNTLAVAQFHMGEMAFRDMRIGDALDHYGEAVTSDSTFALAAIKGALAAKWLHRIGLAEELLASAVRAGDNLPRRFAHLAAGLAAYFEGDADGAVAELRAGVTLAPEWAEGWMMLGDVYFDLLPQTGPRDSLAKAAYRDAVRFDPQFKVPLIPLADYAIWEGQTQDARAMLAEVERGNPALPALRAARLLADCVDEGPNAVDWVTEVEDEPSQVLAVALSASIRGLALDCTEAGARALLGTASPTNESWGGFLLLQSVLAVQKRYPELHALMSSPSVAHLPTGMVYLFDAAAGYDVEVQAAEAAAGLTSDLDGQRVANLWVLGEFEAHRGGAVALDRVISAMSRKSLDSGLELDARLTEILRARSVFLRDGSEGLADLLALRPFGNVMWDLWGALVLERALAAEALLGEGRLSEAERLASEIDTHRSAFHLLLLPRSLAVQAQVAELQGRPEAALAFRTRLGRLEAPRVIEASR